jgi:uncharacterized membrane protein
MQYQSMEKSKREPANHSGIYYEQSANSVESANEKTVAILSYITLVGWLAAIFLHGGQKSYFASFHLRQSLGLIITGALLALIPLIGWLLNIAVCIAWFYAIFHAIQSNTRAVPFIGEFYQQHLDFIK